MNIFAVNENPETAARELCNQHVVKMPTESAQILCDGLYVLNGITSKKQFASTPIDIIRGIFKDFPRATPYSPANPNNQLVRWAISGKGNWEWLLTHGIELCNEHGRRYSGSHKARLVLDWLKENGTPSIPDGSTPFHLTMEQTIIDKFGKNAHEAYRQFYCYYKHFATWPEGKQPSWFSIKQPTEIL